MIHSVFIIHESGLCLLSRHYSGNSRNSDLFSGFLVAVSSFTNTLIGEKIHEISMEHQKIVFKLQKTILLALVTSQKRMSRRKSTMIMNKIYRAFSKQYQEHLKQELIEPSIYEDFTKTIDEILLTSGVIELVHTPSEEDILSSSH